MLLYSIYVLLFVSCCRESFGAETNDWRTGIKTKDAKYPVSKNLIDKQNIKLQKKYMLSSHNACRDDIRTLCHGRNSGDWRLKTLTNFEVIECIKDVGDDNAFETGSTFFTSSCSLNLSITRKRNFIILNCQKKYISDKIIDKDGTFRFVNNYAVEATYLKEVCGKEEESTLSPECHHVIWNFQKNITESSHFVKAAWEECKDDLQISLKNCSNVENSLLLSCMVEDKEKVTAEGCRIFLTHIETIVFSDFRLVQKFTKKCDADIQVFKCGRVHLSNSAPHSQGETIECLSSKINELKAECAHEILRIAELQSEDFHLDRSLYFACREDREVFCSKIVAGEGRVYRCLMHNKGKRLMSHQCREQLSRRQSLVSHNYKVSRSLASSCKQEIHRYHCRKGTSDKRDVRLAQILLCLEAEYRKGHTMSSKCEKEMFNHRQSLLQDYNLSPDLLAHCKEDIQRFCISGDRTVHCLLQHAQRSNEKQRSSLTQECFDEVSKLMKTADVGEDWKIDPVLAESCQADVNRACPDVKEGMGRVFSCLLDNMDDNAMTEECKDAVLKVQYFVARDFTLEPRLHQACRNDAVNLCAMEDTKFISETDSRRMPMILTCLYDLVFHPKDEKKVEHECANEVQRVMRQRALSVRLHPEIEISCLPHLTDLCFENNQELQCLQKNLEQLSNECKNAVISYTMKQAEHAILNPVLMRACKSVMQEYCQDSLGTDKDEGDIIHCLIAHKFIASNNKCKSAVEHFQLMSLKHYQFSYKFKEACKDSIHKHCSHMNKDKGTIISCLSTIVLNDTMADGHQHIPHKCRRELSFQKFQQNLDVRLDTGLHENCKNDIARLCGTFAQGQGKIVECLKEHRDKLSENCHQDIFKRSQYDFQDSSVDFSLLSTCKRMIQLHCSDYSKQEAFQCLKLHRFDADFDFKCRAIIVRRMIEQNEDFRLDPELMTACKFDAAKFCNREVALAMHHLTEVNGKVVRCLKDKFLGKHPLSTTCEQKVRSLMREAARNYNLDPVLKKSCEDEAQVLCSTTNSPQMDEVDERGVVEECLKKAFVEERIKSHNCQVAVAKLVSEAEVDIQVDPLLFQDCVLDVKQLCKGLQSGNGRWLNCLLRNMDHASENCRKKLNDRRKMFKLAEQVEMKSLRQLYGTVLLSPNRNYLLVILMMLVCILFGAGLFCGRITKRAHREHKRK